MGLQCIIHCNDCCGTCSLKGAYLDNERLKLLIIGFDEDNILCFAGAEEGIFCTFQTILTSDMVRLTFAFMYVCMYAFILGNVC